MKFNEIMKATRNIERNFLKPTIPGAYRVCLSHKGLCFHVEVETIKGKDATLRLAEEVFSSYLSTQYEDK